MAQNGAGLVEKGFPDSNFWVKKQGTYVPCFAPIDLTEHGSDLAQNGVELSGNEGHNSTSGASEFVCATELLEYGFPVSSPSGDEPSGACASSAASLSIT